MPYFLLIPLWFLSIIVIGPLFFIRKAKRFSVRWMLGSTLALWPPWIIMLIWNPRGDMWALYTKVLLPALMFGGGWYGVRIADRLGRKHGWPE